MPRPMHDGQVCKKNNNDISNFIIFKSCTYWIGIILFHLLYRIFAVHLLHVILRLFEQEAMILIKTTVTSAHFVTGTFKT